MSPLKVKGAGQSAQLLFIDSRCYTLALLAVPIIFMSYCQYRISITVPDPVSGKGLAVASMVFEKIRFTMSAHRAARCRTHTGVPSCSSARRSNYPIRMASVGREMIFAQLFNRSNASLRESV